MNYKQALAEKLQSLLSDTLDASTIASLIERPKDASNGDLAFPCFQLAKSLRKAPAAIAADIAGNLQDELFEKVENVNGYVNVFLNKKVVAKQTIEEILSLKEAYGNAELGQGKNITIDLSSPNIAKPFSMGHLRSTVIGNAIANIADKCGYNPVRINHLGDWGTQFGKLIVAYKLWGNEEDVKNNTIPELTKLYVKFHEEAEKDPTLEQQGRDWFKRLEDGNEEAVALWKWFREESLKEFQRVYDLLNVSFDSLHGEAFYNDKMDRVVDLLQQKGLLVESDNAEVVLLEDEGMPPCLIRKSDGATLYATRDLAAALYRYESFSFAKSLYVVGNEQSLHFNQLIAVLKKMGYEWASDMKHIPFGLILKDGKKMSTRKGKVVLLEEVLKEAISLAEQSIEKKNPNLNNKEIVAHQVGVGAVIFHDLKNDRMNDIEFSLEEMLKFEGETGPYVQYTHARACSLLRKGNYEENSVQYHFEDDQAWPIVILLSQFPDVIVRAAEKYDPSQVAKYVVDLSQAFNKYYGSVRILDDEEKMQSRLAFVHTVTIVIKEGLSLLGIASPDEM